MALTMCSRAATVASLIEVRKTVFFVQWLDALHDLQSRSLRSLDGAKVLPVSAAFGPLWQHVIVGVIDNGCECWHDLQHESC